MNGRSLAEQLVASGLDPNEMPRKADLFDLTLRGLGDTSAGAPELVLWVPGRLEVFGTHTDYAGGESLVAALPRGFGFAGMRRGDGKLHVLDAAANQSLTLDTRNELPGQIGWRHYVEVVVDRLRRNFPGADLGANIAFASDLPRAAGMSSSSALIVGIAAALTRLSGTRNRDEWRRDVPGPLQEAGYYACIENGRSFGALEGHVGVGTHGGSEDHAAMLCASAASVTGFSFVPMRETGVTRVPDAWQFVVASSGVAAEKTGAAQTSYNRLADGVAVLLKLWTTHESPATSLDGALRSSVDASDRLQRHLAASAIPDWPQEALSSRLHHFIRENARVPLALSAFQTADVERVQTLSSDSQRDSETLLDNQVPQTIALTQLALRAGAFASRSFGAGFGGSVWALIERGRSQTFAHDWLNAYTERFPDHRAIGFAASPAPSVAEVRP